MNVSAKFYLGDKVTLKGDREPQGTVEATNDENQMVFVEWGNAARSNKRWVPGSVLRVLPPQEITVS